MNAINKVLICANAARVEITEAIVEKLLSKGLDVKVYFPFRVADDFKYPEYITADSEAEACRAQLLICMGGDGTILSCSKLASRVNIPVLGINYGHKGFIAALEPEEIGMLDEILAGNFRTEERMMINTRELRRGEVVFADSGLNEATIRSVSIRPLGLRIFCDGTEINSYQGDGLIVATPTGSTAYSMSAGGPIVEPCAKNFIVTPICAHTINTTSFVLMGDRTVAVRLEKDPGFSVALSVDGNAPFALQQGDVVEVKKSDCVTTLVLGSRSFYEIVKQKLHTDI